MRLSEIEFGSLFTYSPRGNSDAQCRSRTVMRILKNDEFLILGDNKILMSDYIAEGIQNNLRNLPFADYFNTKPILVPTPNSSLNRRGTLWVPQRIAAALVRRGLGSRVAECLNRVTPLRKSATSLAADRPQAEKHYDSIEVTRMLDEPREIILVDDVVTRGATLLGAANKLADAFPNARIRAFVAMRTISTPDNFVRINDPCVGSITLVGDGTFRNP
ncbi:MAG: hypothetical protein ACREBB_01935 [Nitrosotalea sp.]